MRSESSNINLVVLDKLLFVILKHPFRKNKKLITDGLTDGQDFGLGSQTTEFIFWFGGQTTVLNFGFGNWTRILNLGSSSLTTVLNFVWVIVQK